MNSEPSEGSIAYYCAPCGCSLDGKFFDAPGVCPECNMALLVRIIGEDNTRTARQRPKVGIFLHDRADIMDVTGPLSVFEHAHFDIQTFAMEKNAVEIGWNVELTPDFGFDDLPRMDVIVLPGGGLSEINPGHQKIVEFLQSRQDSTDILFSVCSGAFFLGAAGLLDGQEATTFASLIPNLEDSYPKAHVRNDVKYTDNEKIVCSSGLSSGMDASFHVVARYWGIGAAQNLANHMEYEWKREHEYARSLLADNYILGLQNLFALVAKEFVESRGDNEQWEYNYILNDRYTPEELVDVLVTEIGNWSRASALKKSTWGLTGMITHDSLGEAVLTVKLTEDGEENILSVRVVKYESF